MSCVGKTYDNEHRKSFRHRFHGWFWCCYRNCWGQFHGDEGERSHCRGSTTREKRLHLYTFFYYRSSESWHHGHTLVVSSLPIWECRKQIESAQNWMNLMSLSSAATLPCPRPRLVSVSPILSFSSLTAAGVPNWVISVVRKRDVWLSFSTEWQRKPQVRTKNHTDTKWHSLKKGRIKKHTRIKCCKSTQN